MVLHDLDYIFDTLDVGCNGYIEWIELKEFDETVYFQPLDIDQLEAAITTVCNVNCEGRCRKEYFPDVVKELERRHNVLEKIKWDFCALDKDETGRISIHSALFLFKAVHGDRFSTAYWKKFLNSRISSDEEVCFDEIKLFLCNIPDYASGDSDDSFINLTKKVESQTTEKNYENHSQLHKLQEDDASLAAAEREKALKATKIKNNAEYLLNRMDEIGLQALLEDGLGDIDFEQRPIEKVTATELLNALNAKYEVLREKLLHYMLRLHIGEGMWQALSEHEQHERLFQLKLKEEKIRKEGKLDTLAIHLPGSQNALQYNLFGLIGESGAELEIRLKQEEEKVRESGLSQEEVEEEFLKKLDDRDQEKSSTEAALLDLNLRYVLEKEALTNKLQGLSGYLTLNSTERENILFNIVQSRLRGVQENNFYSCSICVGLCERIQPQKHDRSTKDKNRHYELSSQRLISHKNKRVHDGPTLPPKLFKSKTTPGRVDLFLLLVQECERKYALEREAFLKLINSKECLMHRMSARKLTQEERSRQLSVLQAQWQGWRSKPSTQRQNTKDLSYRYLEEAMSLRFEKHKEELRLENPATDDAFTSSRLLAALQICQDAACRNLLNVGFMTKLELEKLWKEQIDAIAEEWFNNIAVVLFGIIETSDEEEEILKALSDKYDTLRDKLLMDALMKQYSKAEWDALSEQERQNRLAKLRLLEKKLRREGKYDELAKLLGDSAQNSDLLNKLLGENRQKYLDQLNERLRNRQRRIAAGEDPDALDEDLLEETLDNSTGNVLRDLDKRFEDERDALLRRLRDQHDRQASERQRQLELARLRLEARKAGREANFDSAALVLGLAERNKAALEDRLRNDRERQEQLARERLAARRNRKKSSKEENADDVIEPRSDDILGWQECVLKALMNKHEAERNFLMDLLQDKELEDYNEEARHMTEDERNERLMKLQSKRNTLDLHVKGDQEEHISIMEMAVPLKQIMRNEAMQTRDTVVTKDDVIVSIMADLQQLQDEETLATNESITEQLHVELVALRNRHVEETKIGKAENVAKLIFKYEGVANDGEMVKALDKKYDALLDKLALEALKKQMSDAEWANLTERERQAKLLKIRVEQKRLLKEGKLDEAARLLGEGFQADASLKKLMGENKKRYDELLQERLRLRRERLARGESVDDLPDDVPEDDAFEESCDAKALLEDLQKRYDEEKNALLARLHGADAQFLSEKDRQAELARLKREHRRAQLEDKFGAAALVLGLAERNSAAATERLQNDRARQEQLAKDRLARLREKRASQQQDQNEDLKPVAEGDLISAALGLLEKRHTLEQEYIVEYLQNTDVKIHEEASLLNTADRMNRLQLLKKLCLEKDNYSPSVIEMASLKIHNRVEVLKRKVEEGKEVSQEDAIVSILADLQQKQDKESEILLQKLNNQNAEQLIAYQREEIELCQNKTFMNIPHVLSEPEEENFTNDDVVVKALEAKYDALKDKLILDALEKQMGNAAWAAMEEKQRQQELMKIKLGQKKLKVEGKYDEADKIMRNLLNQDTNLQTLLGTTKAEQEARMREKLALRKKRKEEGLSEEEINALETKEDKQFEEKVANTTSGNVLEDIGRNFEAEKDALILLLKNAGNKLDTERQRQLALARLRRDVRKAQAEEKYDAVALVFGMAKSQQAALNAKMQSDRSRQEQLARQRLEALRKRRSDAKGKEEETLDKDVEPIEETNDPLILQESVLSEMEKKHVKEREFLMKLLCENTKSPWMEKAKELKENERKTKLIELKEFRKQWRDSNESPDEQGEIFQEAVPLRILELQSEGIEDVAVKLLADLQDSQDKEAELTMKDLHQKNATTLKQLVKIQQLARQSQWYDNMAAVLLDGRIFADQADPEAEVIEALQEKYDALKEKIYEEALRHKFGDEWEKMSEREKQEHVARMKANDQFKINDEQVQNDLDSVVLPGMDKLTSKTRATQERKLKDRMEKRKRAKAEGKNLDELDKHEKEEDMAEQDDVIKASDVIRDLQSQFESEKNAIMEALINSNSQTFNERERQLALARLRREKRKIEKEEKYDGAALLLNLAKKNQEANERSFVNERARQEQLARERIEALKRRKKSSANQKDEDTKQDEKDDMKFIEQLQREGTIAIQDSLLNEVEKKHTSEQQILLELLQSLDKPTVENAKEMSLDDRTEQLSLIQIKRDRVKERTRGYLNSQPPEETMSEAEKKVFNDTLTAGQESVKKVIKEALALLVGQKLQTLPAEISSDEALEEASVLLLADLQEKQTQEYNAVMKAMEQADRSTTDRLRHEQRKARRAGWMDNISMLVFGDLRRKSTIPRVESAAFEKELEEEESKLQHEVANQMKELHKELEKEKEQKLASLSPDDIDAFMKDMERRETARRQELEDQIKRQREIARQRLEEKRRKRDDKLYENDLALAMIANVQKQTQFVREKTMALQGAQKDTLEERLRARREARKRRQEEEADKERLEVERIEKEAREKQEALEASPAEDRQNTSADATTSQPEVKKKKVMPPLPGGGLRREKTVVEQAAEIPQKKKEEMINLLIREQTSLAMKISKEQTRQEEMVRLLREKRRRKMEAREQEAAAVLGLGERQKTIVEDRKKGERERQIGAVRERVQRMKYERTMKDTSDSLTDPGSPKKSFVTLAQEQPDGLTDDEKMQKIAAEMEKKFKEGGVISAKNEHSTPEKTEDMTEPPQQSRRESRYGRLDDKTREQILKERQKSKKLRRTTTTNNSNDEGGEESGTK